MSDNLKILLVDDEPMVLEVSGLMLEAIGHDVDSFPDPQEAMTHFQSNSEQYDLAIIDMMMPTMTGKELFIELRKVRPDLIVAIASGYQMNESDESLLAIGIRGFINKPFSIVTLTERLSELTSG